MISERELRHRQVMRLRGEKLDKKHETIEEFLARDDNRIMYVPKGASGEAEFNFNSHPDTHKTNKGGKKK